MKTSSDTKSNPPQSPMLTGSPNSGESHHPFTLGLVVGSAAGLALYYLHATKSGKKLKTAIKKEYQAQKELLQSQGSDSTQNVIAEWRRHIRRLQASIQDAIGPDKPKTKKPKPTAPSTKPSRHYFTQRSS